MTWYSHYSVLFIMTIHSFIWWFHSFIHSIHSFIHSFYSVQWYSVNIQWYYYCVPINDIQYYYSKWLFWLFIRYYWYSVFSRYSVLFIQYSLTIQFDDHSIRFDDDSFIRYSIHSFLPFLPFLEGHSDTDTISLWWLFDDSFDHSFIHSFDSFDSFIHSVIPFDTFHYSMIFNIQYSIPYSFDREVFIYSLLLIFLTILFWYSGMIFNDIQYCVSVFSIHWLLSSFHSFIHSIPMMMMTFIHSYIHSFLTYHLHSFHWCDADRYDYRPPPFLPFIDDDDVLIHLLMIPINVIRYYSYLIFDIIHSLFDTLMTDDFDDDVDHSFLTGIPGILPICLTIPIVVRYIILFIQWYWLFYSFWYSFIHSTIHSFDTFGIHLFILFDTYDYHCSIFIRWYHDCSHSTFIWFIHSMIHSIPFWFDSFIPFDDTFPFDDDHSLFGIRWPLLSHSTISIHYSESIIQFNYSMIFIQWYSFNRWYYSFSYSLFIIIIMILFYSMMSLFSIIQSIRYWWLLFILMILSDTDIIQCNIQYYWYSIRWYSFIIRWWWPFIHSLTDIYSILIFSKCQRRSNQCQYSVSVIIQYWYSVFSKWLFKWPYYSYSFDDTIPFHSIPFDDHSIPTILMMGIRFGDDSIHCMSIFSIQLFNDQWNDYSVLLFSNIWNYSVLLLFSIQYSIWDSIILFDLFIHSIHSIRLMMIHSMIFIPWWYSIHDIHSFIHSIFGHSFDDGKRNLTDDTLHSLIPDYYSFWFIHSVMIHSFDIRWWWSFIPSMMMNSIQWQCQYSEMILFNVNDIQWYYIIIQWYSVLFNSIYYSILIFIIQWWWRSIIIHYYYSVLILTIIDIRYCQYSIFSIQWYSIHYSILMILSILSILSILKVFNDIQYSLSYSILLFNDIHYSLFIRYSMTLMIFDIPFDDWYWYYSIIDDDDIHYSILFWLFDDYSFILFLMMTDYLNIQCVNKWLFNSIQYCQYYSMTDYSDYSMIHYSVFYYSMTNDINDLTGILLTIDYWLIFIIVIHSTPRSCLPFCSDSLCLIDAFTTHYRYTARISAAVYDFYAVLQIQCVYSMCDYSIMSIFNDIQYYYSLFSNRWCYSLFIQSFDDDDSFGIHWLVFHSFDDIRWLIFHSWPFIHSFIHYYNIIIIILLFIEMINWWWLFWYSVFYSFYSVLTNVYC